MVHIGVHSVQRFRAGEEDHKNAVVRLDTSFNTSSLGFHQWIPGTYQADEEGLQRSKK